MSKLIVIQLGSGSLQDGFPLVTAQLWGQPNALPDQFTGALPSAPQLQMLSQSWQALYRALCDRPSPDSPAQISTRSRSDHEPNNGPNNGPDDGPDDELEIEAGGVQNVSSYDFDELCQTLSEQFNQWLCAADFGPIERPLRSRLSPSDHIRILLATPNDAIRRLPWQRWELLQDFPKAELALSLPQYRRQQRGITSRQKPRILAILGNAQGIDLAQEQQLLQHLPNSEVTFLNQPSRQQFHQALWDKTGWDLLFFAGHSSSTGRSTGQLYLNDNSHKNTLTLDELSEALSAALENGLQLAIFNSCDGLGLANQLAHLNIPQVIVMREPVPNRVAQQFFQSFLEAYVQQNLPLYLAIRQSRRQLQALEDDFPGASWLPILCQNPAEEPVAWRDLCRLSPDRASPAHPSLKTDHEPKAQLPRQAYRDRQIFLNKVRNAWIKGVLNKSLPHQVLLSTRLVEQPAVLKTPAASAIEQAATAGYPLPPDTQLKHYFEQLGTGRSLLLLGAPGAGKTTALLALGQSLIDRAEANIQEPMPVVLNLSTWGSEKNSEKKTPPSIHQWLQQSLYTYYQVPKETAEQWLHSGQLSLLLDGLDEVDSPRRRDCVQALNQFQQDYGQVEMVLCSRLEDYQSTGEYLTVQAALVLQPLSTEQIQAYCIALGDPGETLQALLTSDHQLNQLADSPLMLNIIALAAEDMAAEDMTAKSLTKPGLTQPNSLEERRHHLLNTYINRMLSRRTCDSKDSPAAIISGLRYLAQQLQRSGQSVFQIETIQPDWLDRRDRNILYPIILGITLATLLSVTPMLVGLWLGGVWVALSLWLSWGLLGGSIAGFIGGWPGGFTGGLIGGSVSTVWVWMLVPRFTLGFMAIPLLTIFMGFIFGACRNHLTPVESVRWSWRKAAQWFGLGLGVGALISLPIWLAGNVEARVLIPAVGFIFMLLGGFTKRSRMGQTKTSPNEGIWRTGQNALHLGGLTTVIYGLLICVIFGLNTGGGWESYQASLPFGAIAGLIMGTFIGLVGAEGSGVVCIQHLVLRIMLYQQNRIPWNYAQFLDGCASRILLKKVGGSYIFVHRLLQEHFADWRPSR